MKGKKLYQSKTFWANILGLLVGVGTLVVPFVAVFDISDRTLLVIEGVTLFITGVLNLVLRIYFTKEPIEYD